jgi:hypothetical protein
MMDESCVIVNVTELVEPPLAKSPVPVYPVQSYRIPAGPGYGLGPQESVTE